MKVDKFTQKVEFNGEEFEKLVVCYDNKCGESYTEGITICLSGLGRDVNVFLEAFEARRLRDLLLRLHPINKRAKK